MLMPSSEQWGGFEQTGKYPVKVYTIDGVLIYQVDDGTTNTDKTPLGGVIVPGSNASSMAISIANPITFYGWGAVINQEGHSGDLYNYYWTSYSRGTDGRRYNLIIEPSWHNAYLDGYIPLRVKSIYDPCPYLYRIPSNGTYNQFEFNQGWTTNSYIGGASWSMNTSVGWFLGLGRRSSSLSTFEYTASWGFYYSATASDHVNGYEFEFSSGKAIRPNYNSYSRSYGHPVRCIEDWYWN